MSFIQTIERYFKQLPKSSIVTLLWKGLISENMYEENISEEDIIEYSFHIPVDNERYLLNLICLFNTLEKENLLNIDGNLKAYLMTFIYYCLSPLYNAKMTRKALYYAAQLYLKIMLLPADIAECYFEMNLFIVMSRTLNDFIINSDRVDEQMLTVLELLFKVVSEKNVKFGVVRGTCNLFSNCISCSIIPKCAISPAVAGYSRLCLKELLQKRSNDAVRHCVLDSILRYLTKSSRNEYQEAFCKIIIKHFKMFIQEIILNQDNRLVTGELIDILFQLLGEDLDLFDDCVDILNMLNEAEYKEFGYRLAKYLESTNHGHHAKNLMNLICTMINKPYLGGGEKFSALYLICFKDVIIYLLHDELELQEAAINTMARICSLINSETVENIFQYEYDFYAINFKNATISMAIRTITTVNDTGKFVTLAPDSVIKVMNKIMTKFVGNLAIAKSTIQILTKMSRSLHLVCSRPASQILLTMFKNGTPYSIKNVLVDLHELYLRLYETHEIEVGKTIMVIFLRMALHQDISASTFVEHLYNSSVFPSYLGNQKFNANTYSNILFSEEFEYSIFMTKCKHLIRYDHLLNVVASINYRQPGPSRFLIELLNVITYKDYGFLTTYIIDNMNQMCVESSASPLFKAYKIILLNNDQFFATDIRRFRTMHLLLWDCLNKELCSCFNIENIFSLNEILCKLINSDDENRKQNLISIASRRAARAMLAREYSHGSIVHLTQVCIVLKKLPPVDVLSIFDRAVDNSNTMKIIKRTCVSTFIQLLSFYGTLAMMNETEVVRTLKLFTDALYTNEPVIQIMTIKIFYHLCIQLTREFSAIIQFCFNYVTSTNQVLSRICITILEELSYENHILFTSVDYYRFVHRLGSYSMYEFMKHTLQRRFVLSNKQDMGKYFISCLVYLSEYVKFSDYPINDKLRFDLMKMRILIDDTDVIIKFLFIHIRMETKYKILHEMCSKFECLMEGTCKIEPNFFKFFEYSLFTFKVMTKRENFEYTATHYENIAQFVKDLFAESVHFEDPLIYGEYEKDMKYCTIAILKLLFFVLEENLMSDMQIPVLDTVMCWIDYIKPELVHYIRYEKEKDYNILLKKLVINYQGNKNQLENYLNNREREKHGAFTSSPPA